MPRKSPRSLERELAAEQKVGDAEQAQMPSRTARKHASDELQDLGEELVTLRRERLADLDLSDTLLAAIAEARRLTSFGAKRRQAQYIGKLMRKLDAVALAAVREALRRARSQ